MVRPRTMQRNILLRAADDLALSRLVKRTMLPTDLPKSWRVRAGDKVRGVDKIKDQLK
jgi:hypothetical protein